jgi:tetratricopeptide (TPR) repeat protein
MRCLRKIRNGLCLMLLLAAMTGCAPLLADLSASLNQDSAHNYYRKGLYYGKNGDYAKALACFQQAVRLKPDYEQAYFFCALSLFSLNRFSESLQYAKKAVEINPNSHDAYLMIANCHFALKQYKEYIPVAERLLQSDPIAGKDLLYNDKVPVYEGIGLCYGNLGNYPEAIRWLSRVIYESQGKSDKREMAERATDLIKLMNKERLLAKSIKTGFKKFNQRDVQENDTDPSNGALHQQLRKAIKKQESAAVRKDVIY